MKKIYNTVQLTKTLEWVQFYQSLLEEHRDQISYNKSRLIYYRILWDILVYDITGLYYISNICSFSDIFIFNIKLPSLELILIFRFPRTFIVFEFCVSFFISWCVGSSISCIFTSDRLGISLTVVCCGESSVYCGLSFTLLFFHCFMCYFFS